MTTPFRSGSALASRILNAHSGISLGLDNIKFFLYCYNRYLPLNPRNLHRMLDDLSKRLYGRFGISIDTGVCLDEIVSGPVSHARIYRVLLQHIFRDDDSMIIGEMENLAWTKIPIFLNMYPDAKALMIIRDLRDQLVSFKKMTFAPGDDYLISLFNTIDAMDHWLTFERQYPDRFYGIRFEMLKANPEVEAKRLCLFLGVDFEPGMLLPENWTEMTDGKWKTWANHQVSSFKDDGRHKNPVGRWRDMIRPEDLFLCEWIGARQMKAFGITPEGGGSVPQEVFDKAIGKLMSSGLLRDAFCRWCCTGRGVEKYPLDPFDPKTWSTFHSSHPEVFGKNAFKISKTTRKV